MMTEFRVSAGFKPAGDQPAAIELLADGIRGGMRDQVLLGVTGSGKTAVMAWTIEKVQRPTLVIAHNKTLAAQLCGEFKEFFPDNAVEYFVSYYDYYQPEAYVAQSDMFIEKDALVNDEIDKLRHSATSALMERSDVIVVASVSCIFGLGSPEDYSNMVVSLRPGSVIDRDDLIRKLIDNQFDRNDMVLKRGAFRVHGDTLEVLPAGGTDRALRIELFGDVVERITEIDTVTGEIVCDRSHVAIYPASHYVTTREKMEQAVAAIEAELVERLAWFRDRDRLVEAQRLEQRTRYDLEMLTEAGFCSGIENYSRHLTGRSPGEPPYTLLDFFPRESLVIIDESHVTIPQIRGMYFGDRSRKDALVDYGFRLPSAYDNRPLTFEEFDRRVNCVIYTSATPGQYELGRAARVAELIVRPTGLVDPPVEIRPTRGQIDDLVSEVRARAPRERVLVTTLTKRMAEELTEYLRELNIRVRYMHSEVDTLERMEILRDLRLGVFDILVGINLLREGLDLPEVTLVVILDADKEGFLRSETSLIQTFGRAARNLNGRVIMYADRVTGSMQRALDETERRRRIQTDYNEQHGIKPESVSKAVRDVIEATTPTARPDDYFRGKDIHSMSRRDAGAFLERLRREMKQAATALEFERAAVLRDMIIELQAQSTKKK